MKEFMLLVRNEIDHQSGWPAERHEAFVRECMAYIGDLTRREKLVSAQPMVREGVMVSGGAGAFLEGPFSATREVIVGYYHVRADGLADAVAIAKGNPEFRYSTTARVEVRPIKTKEAATQYTYPTEGKR